MVWWTRGELNPRPRIVHPSVYVCIRFKSGNWGRPVARPRLPPVLRSGGLKGQSPYGRQCESYYGLQAAFLPGSYPTTAYAAACSCVAAGNATVLAVDFTVDILRGHRPTSTRGRGLRNHVETRSRPINSHISRRPTPRSLLASRCISAPALNRVMGRNRTS